MFKSKPVLSMTILGLGAALALASCSKTFYTPASPLPPAVSPTATSTSSVQATPTLTIVNTAAFTPTASPSDTPSATQTPTPTLSTTPPPLTFTPTLPTVDTPTFTLTVAFSPTLTDSVTPTMTVSVTPSYTPTLTPTPTITPTPTFSTTPFPSTLTPTVTTTQTLSAFSIVKSLVNIEQYNGGSIAAVTLQVVVCDNGESVNSAVTLADTQPGPVTLLQLGWIDPDVNPYLIESATPGWPEPGNVGGNAVWSSFASSSCVTLLASMWDGNLQQNQCEQVPDTASLSYAGGSASSNLLSVTLPCISVSPTATPNLTTVSTPTFTTTSSATPSPTMTPTGTPTPSSTATSSPTPTDTEGPCPITGTLSLKGNLNSAQPANQAGGIIDVSALNLALCAPSSLFFNSSKMQFVTYGASGLAISQVADFTVPADTGNPVPNLTTCLLQGGCYLSSDIFLSWPWDQTTPPPPAASCVKTVTDADGYEREITFQFYQVNDLGQAGVNPNPPQQAAWAWFAFETTGGDEPSHANMLDGSSVAEGYPDFPCSVDRGNAGWIYVGDFIFFNSDGSLAGEGGTGGPIGPISYQEIPNLYLPPGSGPSYSRFVLNFGTAGLLGYGQRNGLTGDSAPSSVY